MVLCNIVIGDTRSICQLPLGHDGPCDPLVESTGRLIRGREPSPSADTFLREASKAAQAAQQITDPAAQQAIVSIVAMLHIIRQEIKRNRFDPRSVEGMIPRITYGDGR